MINRVLIRIKVVQMLYAYLLTKSEFKIESMPDKQTRDNLYAYKVYVDLLLMILKLSGLRVAPGDKAMALCDETGKNPFSKSIVSQSLVKMSSVREFGVKNIERIRDFADVTASLFQSLSSQSVVKDHFKKRKPEISDEVIMWSTLFNTVILNDKGLINQFRKDDDFTIAGFQKGIGMVDSTLKGYSDTQSSLISAKRDLQKALQEARTLYFALLWLPVEITKMRYDAIESAKEKYLPTHDDLNPNTRFVDNAFVASIRESPEIEQYFKEFPFTWENDYFLIKTLLDNIMSSDIYKQYMEADTTDYAKDAELWRDLFRSVILPSDALSDALEGRSVYWNDDVMSIGTFITKTIRRTSSVNDGTLQIMPAYKDEEDEMFGAQLFSLVVNNFTEYRDLLDSFVNSTNWDPERLAFMDIVIVATALAEILNFPKIPLVVSINEYIEIANYYSTPRSGQFINGVLFAICNHLKEDGLLHKSFEKGSSIATDE